MKIAGFRFFNQSGEQVGPQVLHPLPTAWLPLTAAAAAAGEYTCMYFVEDAGREVPSGRSVPLAVEVRGTLVLSYLPVTPGAAFLLRERRLVLGSPLGRAGPAQAFAAQDCSERAGVCRLDSCARVWGELLTFLHWACENTCFLRIEGNHDQL